MIDGGPSKINPLNSHPSNPIHKAAMAAQSPRPDLKKNDKQASEKPPIEQTVSEKHEINKTAVIIGVVGVVALLFMASRKRRLFINFGKEMQPPPESRAMYVLQESR